MKRGYIAVNSRVNVRHMRLFQQIFEICRLSLNIFLAEMFKASILPMVVPTSVYRVLVCYTYNCDSQKLEPHHNFGLSSLSSLTKR